MKYAFIFIFVAMLNLSAPDASAQQVDQLSSSVDIGRVLHPGKLKFDAVSQSYTISGSGVNTWGSNDECHFGYRKLSGNFILQARVRLLGKGTDPHRKT